MTKPCADYPDLWNYSFQMEFDNQEGTFAKYIRVPLASFAADYAKIEEGVCTVFVDYIDITEQSKDFVIIGSMFF